MNKLTTVLLSGVALGALASAPAIADGAQHFHLMALHAGRAVNKTKLHNQHGMNITSTLDVYTYVPASDFRKTVQLIGTFYRWNSYSDCQGHGKATNRIKVPKKSIYGKLGSVTVTYSICGYEYVFYGDTYKLVDPSGAGKTDNFVSTLYGKFRDINGKYRGTLYLDVSVAITSD